MKKQRSLILSALAIFFFASCEIGLGSSVDTEAPSLEITNPPSDSVIRDDFAIQGTWTDDGSISSVTVDITRLENNDYIAPLIILVVFIAGYFDIFGKK